MTDPESLDPVLVEVPSALDGERVDRVVSMVTDLSRTEATKLVQSGAVTMNGVVSTKGAERVKEGSTLEILVPTKAEAVLPAPDSSIHVPVVFEDEHVIVVDKPADLVVHPGAGHSDSTLVNALLALFPEIAEVGDPQRPGIVHRLDQGTSGLLSVARSQLAYESLVSQLAERSVDRRYRTLVWGHPSSSRGVVDAPIGRSPRHPTKMAVTAKGKPARTRYEVVHLFEEPTVVAELECHLETGRTHQIRVHLSAIGHSVVGDSRYNGVRQSLQCPRPFLHAELLGFDHPLTGEHLEFTSELPQDLAEVLDRLS
ncbi:MAG: RluA family pseudouridine synthase [Acidimicrobiales bacterium]|nr:RluA family pseudouridine synthase [Acidimicrobiales bacterium]